MTTIPSLATWGPTGTIAATTVNNHFSTIRTYVNTYFAQIDATNTWTASQTFAGFTTTTATFSSTVTMASNINNTGGVYTATDSTVSVKLYPSNASSAAAVGTFSAHPLWLVANSVERWSITSSGHLLAVADNNYDIGASGATRPRNLYIAGTGTFGGTITGTLATAAQTAITSVGTLTGLTTGTLTTTGNVSIQGNSFTFAGSAPEVYCGAAAGGTVFNLSNNANTGNYIAITDPNGDSATSATMTLMGGFSLGTLHLGGAGLATNATKGFIEIPDMAGTPSGAAANYSVVWDSTNLRLMIRSGGAWKTIQAT